MEKKEAIKNLQALIDAAVQKGLFENAQSVVIMQQSINLLSEDRKGKCGQ